jgi:hypothetical protein
VLSWFDILSEGAPEPHGDARAIMVDDGTGFWWNYGVAETLGNAGWCVSYVTPSAVIGHQIPTESLPPLLSRLGRNGTRFLPLTQLYAIAGGEVQLINMTNGELEELSADLVVIQTGRMPCDARAAFGLEAWANEYEKLSEGAAEHHDRIVRCLMSGNPDAAAAAMKEHLHDVSDSIVGHLDHDPKQSAE